MRPKTILCTILGVVLAVPFPAKSGDGAAAADSVRVEDVVSMIRSGGERFELAMQTLRSGESGDVLIRALASHSAPDIRLAAVQAIPTSRASEFEHCLRTLTGDPDDSVWLAAWAKLQDVGPGVLNHLRESLEARTLPQGVVDTVGPFWSPKGTRPQFSWSPTDDRLAIASANGCLAIWNYPEHRIRVRVEDGSGSKYSSVLWSPNGTELGLVAATPAPARIQLWRCAEEGTLTRTSELTPVTAKSMGWWSSEGFVVSAFLDRLVIWDGGSGELLSDLAKCRVAPNHPSLIRVSPQGDFIAVVDPEAVRLFRSLEKPFLLLPFSKMKPNTLSARYWPDTAWSPDSSRLAVVGPYGNVGVWSMDEMLWVWLDRTDMIDGPTHVSWSPDGLRLVQTNRTGMFIRNAFTGELLTEYKSHMGRTVSAEWSSSGSRIATHGPPGVILVWSFPPPPTQADVNAARLLMEDDDSIEGSIVELVTDLGSANPDRARSAEGVLATLGDLATPVLVGSLQSKVDWEHGDPPSSLVLRIVSALTLSVGPKADEALSLLIDQSADSRHLRALFSGALRMRQNP